MQLEQAYLKCFFAIEMHQLTSLQMSNIKHLCKHFPMLTIGQHVRHIIELSYLP
jgi:hypothetical protein